MTLRNQRGASAILVALSLLLLMGMAAFAVDLSAAKNERRLDQNGADSSVLAGALEYALGGSAQQIIDEAKAYVATNVRPVSTADWSACADSSALPVLSSNIPGIVGGSPCISFQFAPDDALMRVRVPNQQTGTTFGRVLGVLSLTTSAAAEARIFETANGAYPAGVFSTTGPGEEFCIKTGATPGANCGGSTTGDFGNFQPYFYTDLGGSSLCSNGQAPAPLARSIADGLDHRLGTSPSSPGTRRNGDDCPQFPGPLNPNRVDSGGGASPTDITDGLIKGGSWPGSNTFTGRLTRSNADGSFTIFDEAIDNKPLWEYIDGSEATTPECQQAAALNPSNSPADIMSAEDVMQACLAAETDLLFSSQIASTSRLVTVPQYHQNAPLPSNACCYDIMNFVPLFIQGIWTNVLTCTGVYQDPAPPPDDFCLHEPGMDGSISVIAAGQQKVTSASGLVIDCRHLPAPICATIGAGGTGNAAFFEIELTR